MTEQLIFEKTLGQILDETIEKNPHNPAVIYVDRGYRQSWQEFGDTVDQLAKGLMALGVQKGEKVAVWATNVPYWVALQFATAKIGAILVTVNINYKLSEIEYLMSQSESENLFIINGYRDTDYISTIYELVPELKTQQRGYLKSARFPHLKRVFFLGHEKHRGMYSLPEVFALGNQINKQEYKSRQDSLNCHDVVNMQYTSGTTGFPKGVMLTHYNVGNNGYWIGKNQNLGPNDKICIPVPLFHCFGCVLGVLACVNHGSAMVFLERYEPVTAMMSIERERCTGLYGVPTMFIAILEHPLFEKFNFSSLRTGIMAGSPCPIKTMRQVMELMNMKEITICYGLTESSPVMAQTRYDEPDIRAKTETVGKTMPGVEIIIIDPNTGKECNPGEPGEVCCRGYLKMKGYYNMPEETAKTIDKEGWLHSGDIGIMSEDGYLSITGRLKDMIIRGGENIYPKEIEEFIYHMDGVSDVQVVGAASKRYGEQPAAFIILKPGVEMTPEDVMDYCRGKIAWHKIPKYVHFVTEYPLTASGKIQKYILRELAAKLWPDA